MTQDLFRQLDYMSAEKEREEPKRWKGRTRVPVNTRRLTGKTRSKLPTWAYQV